MATRLTEYCKISETKCNTVCFERIWWSVGHWTLVVSNVITLKMKRIEWSNSKWQLNVSNHNTDSNQHKWTVSIYLVIYDSRQICKAQSWHKTFQKRDNFCVCNICLRNQFDLKMPIVSTDIVFTTWLLNPLVFWNCICLMNLPITMLTISIITHSIKYRQIWNIKRNDGANKTDDSIFPPILSPL